MQTFCVNFHKAQTKGPYTFIIPDNTVIILLYQDVCHDHVLTLPSPIKIMLVHFIFLCSLTSGDMDADFASCACMPSFSNRGTVALSAGWISRIDLCKWTLWSEALSASGNHRLEISTIFVSVSLFPDVSCILAFTLKCSSPALILPFQCFSHIVLAPLEKLQILSAAG